MKFIQGNEINHGIQSMNTDTMYHKTKSQNQYQNNKQFL